MKIRQVASSCHLIGSLTGFHGNIRHVCMTRSDQDEALFPEKTLSRQDLFIDTLVRSNRPSLRQYPCLEPWATGSRVYPLLFVPLPTSAQTIHHFYLIF
jgi:hypothetical protein